jgi:hypothetical protein
MVSSTRQITILRPLDIPRESGILTERELEVTMTDATGLVEGMGKGTWTAEEVTIAFLKRATMGHQLLNYATEFMADEAISHARNLDTYFQSTGEIARCSHIHKGNGVIQGPHIAHRLRLLGIECDLSTRGRLNSEDIENGWGDVSCADKPTANLYGT